ncbi:MAG: type II toxin-antitoxin system HicA family toxin [Nitrospirota bacterium]
MKRKDLEKAMTRRGWWYLRHGGNHDIWTNGFQTECIPRHNEVNEQLAKAILRKIEKEKI